MIMREKNRREKVIESGESEGYKSSYLEREER